MEWIELIVHTTTEGTDGVSGIPMIQVVAKPFTGPVPK